MVTRRTFVGGIPGLLVGEAALAQQGPAPAAEAPPVTRILADYIVAAKPGDLPPAVKREGARTLLNWMGTAIGGAHHAATDHALAAVAPFAGTGQAGLIARRERVDVLNAALLNGIAGHVLDFDDTHLPTIIHPSTAVVPALLALAEYKKITGADFLNALVVGIEAFCRIGNAVSPEHYDRGWHISGTAGVFGAAAAAGKILGLDARQMRWALGLAASQPVGLQESLGYMNKSFNPARAATNGLLAAFLAAQNFDSSERMIEAPYGWAHVVSDKQDYAQITAGLGAHYEIMRNSYKPFPCGIVLHPALDAALKLRRQPGVKADDIARVDLRVHPRVLMITGKTAPADGLESKFSVYHAVAVALIDGTVGQPQFSTAAVNNPRVLALRVKVFPVADPAIATDQVDMTITFKDGRKARLFIEHAVGSASVPMTDDDLARKFLGLADGVLPNAQAHRLMDLCHDVGAVPDAGDIARAAQLT